MRAEAGHDIEGVVHYQVVELAFSLRQAVERLLGNRLVRLEGHPPLYVSKADYVKLWPESPQVMLEKGYTVKAKLRAQPRLLGGSLRARVVSTEILQQRPKISK